MRAVAVEDIRRLTWSCHQSATTALWTLWFRFAHFWLCVFSTMARWPTWRPVHSLSLSLRFVSAGLLELVGGWVGGEWKWVVLFSATRYNLAQAGRQAERERVQWTWLVLLPWGRAFKGLFTHTWPTSFEWLGPRCVVILIAARWVKDSVEDNSCTRAVLGTHFDLFLFFTAGFFYFFLFFFHFIISSPSRGRSPHSF